MVFDELSNGGDEDGGGGVIGVVVIFVILSVDDIDIEVKVFFDVFGVVDYVYVEDVVFVEFFDDVFGGDIDGGNEEFGVGFDDDVN